MLVENQPVDRHVDVFLRVLRIERSEHLCTDAERLAIKLERQILADTENLQSTIVLPVDLVVKDRDAAANASQFLDALLNDEQLLKITLECLLRTLPLTTVFFNFDWSQLVVDLNLKSPSLMREKIDQSECPLHDFAVSVSPHIVELPRELMSKVDQSSLVKHHLLIACRVDQFGEDSLSSDDPPQQHRRRVLNRPLLKADNAELPSRWNITFNRQVFLLRLRIPDAHLELDVVKEVQVLEVASIVLDHVSSCCSVQYEVALLNFGGGHDGTSERIQTPASELNTYFQVLGRLVHWAGIYVLSLLFHGRHLLEHLQYTMPRRIGRTDSKLCLLHLVGHQ